MSAVQWTRLELWRASSLASDTQRVTDVYNRLLREGDTVALGTLREQIEDRIDELAAFYAANVDDERVVLFEKQRMRLRKLLHRTPASVASAAAGPSATARVTLAEVLVWYLKQGSKQHPWLSEDAVQSLFTRLASGTPDGRTTMAELREAVAAAAPEFGDRPVRAPAGAGAGVGAGGGRDSVDGTSDGRGGATDATSVRSGATGSVATSTASARRRRKKKAIYAWEKAALEEEEDEDSDDIDADALVELKGGLVEFQIRLTPQEYAAYACRRRAKAAEQKHMKRRAKAKKSSARQSRPLSVSQTGPYVEPTTLENHFYRNPNRGKWITDRGFTRSPSGKASVGR